MARGYRWSWQLLYVCAVLTVGCCVALGHATDSQHHNASRDYEKYMEQVKAEGAELLTFTRFTDLSESPSTIEVSFSSETQVDDITDILLFVVKINGDGSEQSWTSNSDTGGSIPAEEVRYSFPYNDRLPMIEYGDKVSLVVVARNALEIALAAGEFTFDFQSSSSSLAWVGGGSNEPSAFLRVGTTTPSSIGSECSCDGSKPCYCPQPQVTDLENLEVCVDITGTGNAAAVINVAQCGGDVSPTPFTPITSIEYAELHKKADDTKEFLISATYDTQNSKKVDILFYEDDEPSDSTQCVDLTKPCIATNPPESKTFNILLVALKDDDTVVESNVIAFEDYSIELKQLTSDAVEVTWSGSSSKEYEVLIGTNDVFTKTTGNKCMDDKCKAYFVKITGIPKFTVYIKDDLTLKSSTSLKMDNAPNQATFTSITKLDSSKISVKASVNTQSESDVVSLVVITVSEGDGNEDIYVGTHDLTRNDIEYQFPVDLESSEGKVYFILVGHQENGAITFAGTATGKIEEVSAELTWVGAAYSEVDNKATLRSGSMDDSDTCAWTVCGSSGSPCYCIHTDLDSDDITPCSELDDDVLYCDKLVTVDQYNDFTTIKQSRLLYPLDTSEDPSYEFEADSTTDSKYELIFLFDDDLQGDDKIYSCDASDCKVPLNKLKDSSETYQVLAVALDIDSAVLQSKEFPFEDYKVTLQAVTPVLILANWKSANDTTFYVTCSPEDGGVTPAPTNTICQENCMLIFDGVTCGSKLYTLDVKEKEGSNNIVAGQTRTLACDTAELSVSTPELRYDDHLRVCFSKPSQAHKYQLILEHEGVVIEAVFYDATQLDADNKGNPCLVGTKRLSLGSHVDLRVLVVAYDIGGNVIAYGKIKWEAILLSSDRWVQAAITEESTIISSWQVIDDSEGIDNIILTLKSETGSEDSQKIPSDQTSYKIRDIAAGSYSVCTRAVSSNIQSEEVCSGIITITENSGIEIPPPESAEPKSSGNDNVMITWNQQEDVTAYMVFWKSTSNLSEAKLLKPLNSLSLLHPNKNRVDVSEGNAFKIIPASSSSFEISGLSKGEWDVCLSGVKDGNVGKENCQLSQVDPDNYQEITAPTNLRIEESILKWNAISDINKYFVEWISHGSEETGGHDEISGTSFNLQNKINPGKWSFTVRAVKESQLGETQTIIDTLKGIQISWEQVGSNSLLVEWQELPHPGTLSATYIVSYNQEGDSNTIEVNCNLEATSSCQAYILDIDVDTSKSVVLQVARKEEDTKREIDILMSNLKEISHLEQTMKSSNQTIVRWSEVEGAKYYNVSLYRDQLLLKQNWQTLPRSVTLEIPDLEGCDVRVQPCIDNKHCVDGKQIKLKIVIPEPSDDVNGLLVVSILGGILGAAIVVSAIIVIVYKYKSNRSLGVESQSSSSNVNGGRARSVSTVSIVGQSHLYDNNMELRPSRPTYNAWRTQ